MLVAVVNESKDVSARDAQWIARAMRVQMAHVARAYGLAPLEVVSLEDYRAILDSTDVWPIILTSDADRARSLGIHLELAGDVYSYVFVKTITSAGGAVLNGTPFTVCGVAGHELGEMVIDPHVNMFIQLPKGLERPEGDLVAYEIGDPVQDEYEEQVGLFGFRQTVSLSNFVWPSWFKPGPQPSGTQYDQKGRLTAPFTTLDTGYLIIKDSKSGAITSTFDRQPPPWKRSEFSRTVRRGVSQTFTPRSVD